MAGGIEDTVRSNSSRVLITGNAAVLSRVRALEASRAVISASTRVRSSSSGAHRWVFAVSSSSGASWRIAASLSRRSPSARSGASAGGGRAHDGSHRRCVARDGVVGQRAGRDDGQLEHERVPGGGGLRCPGAGGEDGPHVGGPPPAERDRPVQRGEERLLAVGGAQGVQLGQLGAQPGVAGRGGAGDERLRGRAERAERLLRRGLRAHRPPRRRPRAAVVLIEDRRLARRDQHVLGDHLALAGAGHDRPAAGRSSTRSRDLRADQPDRHRVAGRAEPDAGQPVDLAGHQPRRCSARSDGSGASSSRSMTSRSAGTAQISLCTAALTSAHHAAAAAFAAARSANGPGPAGAGDHQVGLGVADQVLHDPLRLRVRGLAEVRPEPVVRGEPHVLRRGHHHVRRPRRPSGSPSGRPAPRPAPRPASSKHSASSASVVSARSSSAKRTNRNRHQASTAQNTCSPPSTPQSMTRCSPGDHTAGRRPR